MFLFGGSQYICAPYEEVVPLTLVESVGNEALPQDLNLLWLEHGVWALSYEEPEEIEPLHHFSLERVVVDPVGYHCVKEATALTLLTINRGSESSTVLLFEFFLHLFDLITHSSLRSLPYLLLHSSRL